MWLLHSFDTQQMTKKLTFEKFVPGGIVRVGRHTLRVTKKLTFEKYVPGGIVRVGRHTLRVFVSSSQNDLWRLRGEIQRDAS